MTPSDFFQHWGITENPFQDEEARNDGVFSRMGRTGSAAFHADFEKVVGDLFHPSSAVVFGEKGSGKTAIRLQLAQRVADHNQRNPEAKILFVPYDALGITLDVLHQRLQSPSPLESFQKMRLVDHLDGILAAAAPGIVDAFIHDGVSGRSHPAGATTGLETYSASRVTPDLSLGGKRPVKRLTADHRDDLQLLQAVYDRPDEASQRTAPLRARLGRGLPWPRIAWAAAAYVGWVPAVALYVFALWANQTDQAGQKNFDAISDPHTTGPTLFAVLGLLALWLACVVKRSVFDRLGFLRLGSRIRKQVRVLSRSDASYGLSLRQLQPHVRDLAKLPLVDSDASRYALIQGVRRLLAPFGYKGVMIVVDRVDEPTLVNGDAERMRAIVWPLLNNRFLQQEGVGVKMLLPIELRHSLYRESASFFQEARLDKQSMIDRLSWTGAMLYDLCNARLQAVRDRASAKLESATEVKGDLAYANTAGGPVGPSPEGAAANLNRSAIEGAGAPRLATENGALPRSVTLIDLFTQDVTMQDLVDALDQMHQPREALKFMYRCVHEHCSSVVREQNAFRIPRHVLDAVRKQESDRVQQLYRGIRPA
ncbi:MAG: hypothetical protein SFZ23_14695 [Planctomycetota bacterium]|nr:hypothetical protein [Planctomycetota bacterium]